MDCKVFTNDIGPKRYSCFCDVSAATLQEAVSEAETRLRGLPANTKFLVIPFDFDNVWPDPQTGRVAEYVIEKFGGKL